MPNQFGKNRSLQLRMGMTMFSLSLLYAAFVGVILTLGSGAFFLFFVAGAMLLIQLSFSDKIALSAMGAHEVTPQQAPELHALIERLALQADIPKPKVAIADTSMPNAFAMGRSPKHATVCATTGILNTLSPAELEGVMAHEVGHIVNRDVAIMTYASFFASIASLIVQFGLYFGGGHNRNNNNGGMNPVLLAVAAAAVVWILSFFMMRLLSRQREYAADRAAAVITGNPSALSSALMKISGEIARIPDRDMRKAHSEMNAFYIIPATAKESLMSLFSTHPPTKKRIEALSVLERQLQSGTARTANVY